LVSVVSVLWLVPLVRKAAIKNRILDVPDGGVKLHEVAVPHFGGVAVCLALTAGLLPVFPSQTHLLWLYLGSLLLLFLGVVDDLHILSAAKKFVGQLFVVFCFLLSGFVLKTSFFSSTVRIAISGLWMLTVINAFNLIDVMDGLATTVAFCACAAFCVCAFWVGNFEVTLFLVALMGALIGFFYYNKPPASIYLGDAGAHFVGGILAAVPMLISWSEFNTFGFLVPAVILGVALAEVATLIFLRLRAGISPFAGSPHHFAIYLRNKGWSRMQVLAIAAAATAILSLFAFLFFLGYLFLFVFIPGLILSFLLWCFFVFS
ncbi:undecaprenyl/decaprenyl-phosphate alpha-N-acetylglucosaminyl 1-phosphate transferase, partial [Candidatus Babeliales bacterium]|nr:undecaprenyl/decaprenyl-phosphate alpha-N-acetylglucosaminyl 1-phosphate transferase [Candidatus Babeliales bacterium]